MTPRKETPIATRQAVINMRENGMRGTEIAMMTSYRDLPENGFDEINSYISAVISLIFNIALAIATSRVSIYSKHVRRMQLVSCFFRLLLSTTIVIGSPTIAFFSETEAVYIVKGGIKIDHMLGIYVLVVFLALVVFVCTGPPAQFLQVTFLMNRVIKTSSNTLVNSITCGTFVVAIITIIIVYIGYVPQIDDYVVSREIVYYLNGKGTAAFLIASIRCYNAKKDEYETDYISLLCTSWILFVLTMSTIIVIICYINIRRKMKSDRMSTHALKSQEQLNIVLIVQFILPFVTIHIPFYISFLVPLFDYDSFAFSIYLPYLFSWCPALNPVLVMITVKSIRERILNWKSSTSNNNSSNIVLRPRIT